MISITLKVGEPHEVILRDSFFLMEQATRALFSFPNPYSHVVHNHHLVVTLGKRNPTQIGHNM
jgi:hypothetical protein